MTNSTKIFKNALSCTVLRRGLVWKGVACFPDNRSPWGSLQLSSQLLTASCSQHAGALSRLATGLVEAPPRSRLVKPDQVGQSYVATNRRSFCLLMSCERSSCLWLQTSLWLLRSLFATSVWTLQASFVVPRKASRRMFTVCLLWLNCCENCSRRV